LKFLQLWDNLLKVIRWVLATQDEIQNGYRIGDFDAVCNHSDALPVAVYSLDGEYTRKRITPDWRSQAKISPVAAIE
jgi:hypothetical protein